MTYINPMMQYGFETLLAETENLIDGILIFRCSIWISRKLCQVQLNEKNIAFNCNDLRPTTPVERLEQISARATGFLYHVAENGLTGGEFEFI